MLSSGGVCVGCSPPRTRKIRGRLAVVNHNSGNNPSTMRYASTSDHFAALRVDFGHPQVAVVRPCEGVAIALAHQPRGLRPGSPHAI